MSNSEEMSNSEGVSNSEGMSNSEVRIIFVEHQRIHSCIRNITGSKCDWNPNTGQFICIERSRFPALGPTRNSGCCVMHQGGNESLWRHSE